MDENKRVVILSGSKTAHVPMGESLSWCGTNYRRGGRCKLGEFGDPALGEHFLCRSCSRSICASRCGHALDMGVGWVLDEVADLRKRLFAEPEITRRPFETCYGTKCPKCGMFIVVDRKHMPETVSCDCFVDTLKTAAVQTIGPHHVADWKTEDIKG